MKALAIVDDRGIARMPTRTGIQSGSYPFDRFLLIYARREADGRLPQPRGYCWDGCCHPLVRLRSAASRGDTSRSIAANWRLSA